MVTRCFEYLSSGEKRAGWAETVGVPLGEIFCEMKRKIKINQFDDIRENCFFYTWQL
jgi:hypothetical protein